MNYPKQIFPRLLPNEVVQFANSGRKYKVEFWYPMREYRFIPIRGKGAEYTETEENVAEAIRAGRILDHL